MTQPEEHTQPPDICMLLRIHGEQRWLASKVEPLVHALEQPDSVGADETGAALAYLEVTWLESGLRAAETDAAFAELDPADGRCSAVLYEKACRYHAAVRRLRESIDRRVRGITSSGLMHEGVHSQEPANS